MSQRRLAPPSCHPPPASVVVSGTNLDLVHLAQEICRRYQEIFPDEEERYGETGQAWCIHDNQHLLNWAAGEVNGYFEMAPQVAWLAKILEVRGFPIDRLARNLAIASEVVLTHVTGRPAAPLAEVLANAAIYVRQHGTFL